MIEAITPQDETVYLEVEDIETTDVFIEGTTIITGNNFIQRLN